MAHPGKFDALTKDLITHFLGFEEGEENFLRSEQFVLSNLLYHHCLAVNSHAVRRSIDGLGFKFRVHGQENRSQKLSDLTSRFMSSSLFKDHYETDIEWSLLSFLLHLSNSPTQVPETEEEVNSVLKRSPSIASSLDVTEEQIDWVSYLLKGEKECVFGPEDPLSDWSDSDEEEYLRSRKDTDSYRSLIEEELCIKQKQKSKLKDWKLLEHSHRARSWISGNMHVPYWKGAYYQHEALSSHRVANIAGQWEEAKKTEERSQLLSEWAVIRELIWIMMCPVSSYIFQQEEDGSFVVKNRVTVPSLTAGAMAKFLEDFCISLKQLNELESFMHHFEEPEVDPPTPVTLLAYVTGLRLWRKRFQAHLINLEGTVKNQETTCTLIWLEKELMPWIRVLASIYEVHHAALKTFPGDCSRNVALRLIGSLCQGVECAGEEEPRGVLLRLLLHTLRHYFSIMHSWLVHGALIDFANEFIIQRNDSVKVTDETFWKEAFTLNCHPESQDLSPGDPLKIGLKILLPLALALTCIGKSQELLSALVINPSQSDSSFLNITITRGGNENDKPLDEFFVEHVIKIVNQASCTSENTADSLKEEQTIDNLSRTEVCGDDESVDALRSSTSKMNQDLLENQRKEVNHHKNVLEIADSLLHFQDFSDFEEEVVTTEVTDTLDKKIESIEEVLHAVSVVNILSSSMRPLITEKQEKLNVELTDRLISEHQLDRHCRAVRSVLMMEAGDIMHEFCSNIFTKVDQGERVDSLSLTLHLEYCIARLYPDLARLFSVNMEDEEVVDGKEKKEAEESVKSKPDNISEQLSALGLPSISIHYQAPWPMNLLFSQDVMKKYNVLFRFTLSLERATAGLERLKFKDMASWNVLGATTSVSQESNSVLQSRLHRLQLLRLWLLSFTHELRNYFANVVFLPYYQSLETLIGSKPSFSVIISEHGKLLNRALSLCLIGSETKVSSIELVLNKVFWLTQQLNRLWVKDIASVNSEELSTLETHYVQVHRFIVNILSHLTKTRFLPHLEGLSRTLANTMPLQTL